MRKKLTILGGLAMLCLTIATKAQTTLYFENFNAGGAAFTMNASDIGSDPAATGNRWVTNATYNSFFGNTPTQPAGIVGNPTSTYMHIRSALTANATFLAPADGNKLTKMNTGVSTLGATNVTLSFWLLCNGDAIATDAYFGRTYYSIDGGNTWIQNPTTYAQIDSWTQVTVTNPVFDNQADLRFAFMWVQNSANEFVAADPAYSIDDVKIEGITNITNSITTGTISGSPFCAGATFTVPFTSSGTFNGGNTYTAQLSDASGSFTSPINIGTLVSTANAGTISVTIPGGTPTGSGYLIRIISDNPAITGTSSLAFTINAPVTPTFTAISNVCQNAAAPVLPTTSNNGISGTWSPAVSTATAGTTTYTFTPNVGQCAVSTTLDITVDANVTPTFTAVANVCQNATAPVLPTTSNNGISGTWSPAVSTATAGTTTYTFTPTAGQCAVSTTLDITVDANVTPTFTAVANVCQNATAPVLPTTSNNGISGTWSPAVSTAIAGTTTYTFTPSAGQCAVSTTLDITVDANVTPTFTAVANVCQNATAPVLPTNSNNGITGAWSPAVSTATAGTTTYTFTPNAGQCAISTTLNITVDAPVTPTFATIGPLCLNASAPSLPGASNNTTPIIGTWSPATINTASAGITTYTFTPNVGECATTTTLDIEITNSITPVFSAIGPLCLGSTAPSLPTTSNNIPAISGTWSPAVINTASVGTFTYTFTPDAGQCAGTTTMDITITNSITPSFAAIGPFCENTTPTTLPLSSTNLPAITGTWNPATINTSTVGIVTYTFTPDAGQCAANATLDIEITAANINPIFSAIGPLCLNSAPPSLANISTNAITGTWNPATINTTTAGISTYTFTPNAGQCATIATMDIEITTSIIPSFAAIGPLCLNSAAPTLPTSSTNLPAITGTWNPSSISTSSIGIVTYNFTADPNQCAANTTMDIEVSNSITPTFTAIAPICQGAAAPSLPSSSNNIPAITGTWSPSSINTNVSGIVTYTFTPDAGQCGITTTMDVEVIAAPPAPAITIAANITTICSGQSVDFTATPNSSNTGDIIQWFINGTAVTGGTGLLFSSNTLNNNDQITAVFTPSSSCLSGQTATSNIILITVNPTVTPTVSISTSSTIICEGDNVTFNAIVNGGGSNPQLQWFINGNAVSGATGNSFSSSTLANNEQVTVQLTSNAPCASPTTASSNTLVMSVSPYGTPTISIAADKSIICVGQVVTFNATTQFGGAAPQFIWQIGSNSFTSTNSTFTATGLTSTVSISCTMISNYACTTNDSAISNSISIQVNPVPSVTLSEDVTIQEGESTTLTATTSENLTYLWSPSESLSCSDCLSPTAAPLETTVYNFVVTDPATNCSASDSLKVTVIRNYDIWVPNAFSPNNDNINDYFAVRGNNIKEFTIKIYDRWGTKLFETSNIAEVWSGDYQNRKVNSGVYVYVLDYILNDGTTNAVKGNITVSN
ncbi:MAG TPA: gliding motility-associated C-terminal domain-containing protein [Bacteroidia bacterium]|nr:gliding motility-associated C-terminal domain-containing protein [Bacteroidia bacterium]